MARRARRPHSGGLVMTYHALKAQVKNRGKAPDSFLDELIAWGKDAPDEIFVKNDAHDVYSSVRATLGPWRDNQHRRAVMLEVMRVLAGFESSWDSTEAGAFQVSANSMSFGPELKALVIAHAGAADGETFQAAMKSDHPLAMEYIARLLRRTVNHNGPVKRHEIDEWLRKDAVDELLGHLGS